MQPTHTPQNRIVRPTFKRAKSQAQPWSSTRHAMSTYIVDEIRAYGVIRDLALAEAEKMTNPLNLERARIANEFVKNTLKPARATREAQRLPAADAARE